MRLVLVRYFLHPWIWSSPERSWERPAGGKHLASSLNPWAGLGVIAVYKPTVFKGTGALLRSWFRSSRPGGSGAAFPFSYGNTTCIPMVTVSVPRLTTVHASNMEITQLFYSYCVFYLEKLEKEEAAPCLQGTWGSCVRPVLCTAAQGDKDHQWSHLSVIKYVLVLHVNGAAPAFPGWPAPFLLWEEVDLAF